jgi:hypothetical protein
MDRAANHACLDDEQHLAPEIDLERAWQRPPRFGRRRPPQRSARPWADSTVAADPLPALEGHDGIASLVTENAVDLPAAEVAEADQPSLQ